MNLEEEVERIRSDNKSLRSLNEELRAQLLHESVERGQMLLADGPSLAAELNGLNSDEVRESLNKENIEVVVILFFLRFITIVFGFSFISRILQQLFSTDWFQFSPK